MWGCSLGPMSKASAEQLASDLEDWGGVAVGLARSELRKVLPSNRADRLYEWVRTNGSADPRRLVRSNRERVVPIGRAAGRTHVVVGDCHAGPGQDLRRFAWLARLVNAVQPDVLVQIGDWYNLGSLCYHSTAKERADQRLTEDLLAGEMALEAFENELRVPVERHFTGGNHDERMLKVADDAPWMDGVFSVGAAHEARGWSYHPYLEPVRIDGIRYQHYLPNQVGKAISGKYQTARMLERVRYAESVVVGHSHRLDYRTESDHHGRRVSALVSGCYMEHVEEYAGSDNYEWWRGVCILRNVRGGDFDLETMSMARIKELYG